MGLILIDGGEDASSWVSSGTVSISTGRYQGCLRVSPGGTFSHTLLSVNESDTLLFGAAIRWGALPSSETFLSFRSDAGATSHLELQLNSNGSLNVIRPFSTIATSSAGLILGNTWYYVEMRAKLSDTVGFVTVRLDGAQVLSFPTGDTKNAGTKTVFDQVRLHCAFAGSLTLDVDDIYLENGAADPYLGGITVETLLPNGNGNANQWVGSDGNSTDNYLLVDDPHPISTTDYTSTATVGQQDLYALGDLVHTTGNIVAICHSAHMLRTDSVTPINVKMVNRRAADTKSASLPLGTAYRSYEYCLTVDPETGLPFTIADVNGLQTGVELA